MMAGPAARSTGTSPARSPSASSPPGTSRPPHAERTAVAEAVRLADLWLDQVTDLPSGMSAPRGLVARGVGREDPARLDRADRPARREGGRGDDQRDARGSGDGFGPIAGIMGRMGGLMFGAQVGQALGALAGEVRRQHRDRAAARPGRHRGAVPAERRRVRRGLDARPTRSGCSWRCARPRHQRLFAHVPWLRQQLLDTVDAYARGITIDRLERASRPCRRASSTRSDPESIAAGCSAAGCSSRRSTPEQQAALRRLETLLALVEGWVDAVVPAAADDRLPGGRRAARDDAPPTGHRRPGRADLRHPGRPGAAAAPAAGGRRAVGGDGPAHGAPGATACGPTPTCCPPPTTSTIRWTSSPARASTTSSTRSRRASEDRPSSTEKPGRTTAEADRQSTVGRAPSAAALRRRSTRSSTPSRKPRARSVRG